MIVIHHNPDCGTSRNVLRVIEAAGYEPIIIEYLKEGWTRPQLLGLLWQHQWLYVVGPVVGGQLAVWIYRQLSNNFHDFDHPK